MKKRSLALFLAFVMSFALLPAAAFAAGSATVRTVVPATYQIAEDFQDGYAVVARQDGLKFKYGIINETGTEVVPAEYNAAHNFVDGIALVHDGSRWGAVDTSGKLVIPCQYISNEMSGPVISDGMIRVRGDDRQAGTSGDGYLDTSGRLVIPYQFYRAWDFHDGVAVVRDSSSRWGYIDKTGALVVPYGKYTQVSSFDSGLGAVLGDSGQISNGSTVQRWGLIDASGREVVPCQYVEIGAFSQGLAAVRSDAGWGYIDTNGQEVIPCKYNNVQPFSEGLAAVQTANGWGYIDRTGKTVIPCKYNNAESFAGGLAAVKARNYNGSWGFINTAGKETTPCSYDRVINMGSGFGAVFHDVPTSSVFKSYLACIVNAAGKEITPLQYWDAKPFSNGLAAVQTANGWGYIDIDGHEVIPCQYGNAQQLSEGGMLRFQLNNSWGYLSVTGLPTVSTPTQEPANIAHPNTQTVTIDGRKVEFQIYSIKDEKGNDTSYIKIRDLALALKGTAAQFDVGQVNGVITFTSGGDYKPNGSENSTPYSGKQTYTKNSGEVSVNGTKYPIDAFQITYNGAGYTYFQLRDIAQKLNFNIAWRGGAVIETDKPYTGK